MGAVGVNIIDLVQIDYPLMGAAFFRENIVMSDLKYAFENMIGGSSLTIGLLLPWRGI